MKFTMGSNRKKKKEPIQSDQWMQEHPRCLPPAEELEELSQPEYQLRLRPLPDNTDPDGTRRLRAALKRLLRTHRLRCVEVIPQLEGEGEPSHPTPMGQPPLQPATDDKASLVERLRRLSLSATL